MKFWTVATSLTVSLLILSGCQTPTPASKESVVIDKTLPVVTLTQKGILTGMTSVAFEWKAIKNPRVEGIYVYRKAPSKLENEESKLAYYTTIENRFKTHYVDTDVTPDTEYTYQFQTFSKEAQSPKSRLIKVHTLPVLQSVAWIHSITGMPRVAKIIWRPHSNQKVKYYIIERKTLEDEQWNELAKVYGRLNAEYIDEGLEDNHVYMYRVRVGTYDGIISTPSEIVKVVTKALPLPVKNIRATNSLPKKIKLNWSVSKAKDFYKYNLYRSEKLDGNYKLIANLYNNSYVDKIDEDGKVYFYRVSVVDKDGLESEHDKYSVQGMTLNKPLAPAIVEAKLLGDKIELVWSKTDPRSVAYLVTKEQKKGWFDESTEAFDGLKSTVFIDKKIEPNSTYTYRVYSIDKYDITSEPSMAVKIVTPESQEIIVAPKKKKSVQKSKTTKSVTVKQQDVISPVDDLDLSGL